LAAHSDELAKGPFAIVAQAAIGPSLVSRITDEACFLPLESTLQAMPSSVPLLETDSSISPLRNFAEEDGRLKI
jgi:hypothetical protein